MAIDVRSAKQAFLDALDRPAREAIRLSARSPWLTAGPFALGLSQLGLALWAARGLAGHAGHGPAIDWARGVDPLRALLEGLVLVAPGSVILATYARVLVAPRALLAAYGLGVLTAGFVALATLPVCALLAVVAAPDRAAPICVLLPAAVAVLTIASVTARVLRTLDSRSGIRPLSLALGAALVGTFVERLLG